MDLFKGLMIQSITIFCWQSFINPLNLMCSYLKNRKQRVQINYCFRIRRFFSLVQMKKVISMNYGSSTSSWKPWRWVRLNLIFSMRDIYINYNLNQLTKFTRSCRSTKLKDILPWNIYQVITKTIPVSTRIVISYMMKWGIPLWIWWKVNGNRDNMIRIS